MFETTNPISELLPGSKRGGIFAHVLGRVIDWSVIAAVVLVPLTFLPNMQDVLELNKQTIFVILTMVAVLAWVGKAILERSFSLTRSWIHLVVVCFLGGYALTSWFSLDRYLSFVGNFGQMQWSFATVAAFVMFYLVLVNRFRSAGQVYDLALWFLLSSVLTGVYALLQMAGIFIVPGIAAAKTFNSIGTVNALGVYMVIPTVLAASLTVLGCREKTCVLSHESWRGKFWHGVIWAALIVGLLTAVAVDYWVVWAGLLFGDVLLVAIPFIRTRRFGHPVTLAVPTVVALLAVLLLLFRTPLQLNLPSEVSPSFGHTWQIAQQTLRDQPLFGSGPGTWIYDYAKYRSLGVNLSQFWNVRFERGISAFFTLVAMLGIVGTAIWVILILSAIVKSGIHLVREKNDDLWQAYLTVFTAWITLVFIAFLYNYNVSHHLAFWFLLGLLGVMVTTGEWTWDQRSKPLLNTIMSVLFLLLAVGAISVTWLAGQRLAAELKYSSSVASFQRGDDVQRSIDLLYQASSLNRLNDVYARNLSQAHLIKAGRMLEKGAPDQETSKLIRDEIAASLEQANRATKMSPSNVDNWSNLAAVYQAITSFTPGADEQALANFEEALKREPNNPVFMDQIGKLHLLRSDAYRQSTQSPDEKTRKEAEGHIKEELDKAADWFNRSITAKPDFATAHFNLGLVYERQGRLNDAVTKLEQVLTVNSQDVGVAFQLATLYARNNQTELAMKLFEQIVQSVPDYANARWLLAALYEEQGQYEKAIAQVEAVAKTNPGVTEIDQKIADLKQALATKAVPKPSDLPPPVVEEIKGPSANDPVRTR